MESMYLLLKSIHMSCALISIGGFILRGTWKFMDSPLLYRKTVKIAPHAIDTLFLLSGVGLALVLSPGLFLESWLLSKIFLLVVYIILGVIAFRSSTKLVSALAFISAILTFAYIVGIAVTKSPAGWFV